MSVLALAFWVFYREYTKFLGFDGETMLSLLHTHTFVLAVIFPLLFTLVIYQLQHTTKELRSAFWTYYIGWGISIVMMFVRGIAQVQELGFQAELITWFLELLGSDILCFQLDLFAFFLSLLNEVSKKINIDKYFMVFYSSCYD